MPHFLKAIQHSLTFSYNILHSFSELLSIWFLTFMGLGQVYKYTWFPWWFCSEILCKGEKRVSENDCWSI